MARKTFNVADGQIKLTIGGISRLLPGKAGNYVSIIATEDASAGQYEVYVSTVKGEVPRMITGGDGSNQGIIDATKIGPSTPIPGEGGVQFAAPVSEITVVAVGVVGQTTVDINVTQI